MPGLQQAERRPEGHHRTSHDRRRHRLICGPQAARVQHADDAAPGQHPGVDHPTGAGRMHHRRRRSGQIDPAMAGQPRLSRRIEPSHHARRQHGPRIRRTGRRPQSQADQQPHENRHADEVAGFAAVPRPPLWTTERCG
jgi:hypothetical protein